MTIRVTTAAFLTLAVLIAPSAQARQHRSHAVTDAFERTHPCPSTGKKRGACPGWVKDHIQALCDGGADDPANMQWQAVAEAKAKDRRECRSEFAKLNRQPHAARLKKRD